MMNVISMPTHSLRRPVFARVLLLVMSSSYLTGCLAHELEPITYQEAVELHRQAGGDENYRCALVPADQNYRPLKNSQPIAVEIDEVLFIKSAGAIQQLQQQELTDSGTSYKHQDMSAQLSIISRFNPTEYGESEDRHVDLTFTAAGETKTYRTFGEACGL
jgi:hypothetical protein